MAGQGGPDEETWKRMRPVEKKLYWACVGVVLVLMIAAALYKVLH